MNSKKANRAFLITIILYIVLVYSISFFAPELGNNIFASNFLTEAIIVLPLVIFMFASKEKPVSFMGFHKMKISTLGMLVLFTMLSSPFISLLNLFSQLWVENVAVSAMESMNIGQMPLWQVLLPVAVFAPFMEEVACRGIYYPAYKKSGSKLGAMLLSALIFALIHMNLNQAIYAFGMGVMAVLLVEATGSLWSAILYHGLMNGSQIVLLYGALRINPNMYSQQAELLTGDTIIYGLAVYLVLTAITLPLAWAVLVWMSGNEGRRQELTDILKRKPAELPSEEKEPVAEPQKKTIKKDKLVTVSLILGLILCVAMMTGILSMIIITLALMTM